MRFVSFSGIALLFFLMSNICSFSQIELEWVKTMDGPGNDDNAIIRQDFANNLIVIGGSDGPLDLDPGPGTNAPAPIGKGDYYVQKFDAAGNLLWAHRFGSTENEAIKSVLVNSSGEIYIAGNLGGTADLDPGPGTATATGNFIQKLNPNGSLQWLRFFKGVFSISMEFDKIEALLVAGTYGYGADLDPGPGTYTIANAGTSSMCLIKLNAQGIFKWAQPFDAPLGSDLLHSTLSTDNDKNIFLTGRISGTFDFDLGVGSSTLSGTPSGFDHYVLKLDSLGAFIWVRLIKQIRPEGAMCDSFGNLVLYGSSWLGTDLDPGTGVYSLSAANPTSTALDGFVLKVNGSTGSLMWARGITISGGVAIFSASFLPNDEILFSGVYRDSCTFIFNGAPSQNFKTQAVYAGFIAHISSTGYYRWHKSFEAPGTTTNGRIHVTKNFGIYYVGSNWGVCDLDPGPGITPVGNSNPAMQSTAFMIKYNSKTLAVEKVKKEVQLVISPNPNNGNFHFSFEQNCNLEIYDLGGKLMFQKYPKQNEDLEIETGLQKGLYFVRVITPGKSDVYRKMVVE